jgi:hypothetical protein
MPIPLPLLELDHQLDWKLRSVVTRLKLVCMCLLVEEHFLCLKRHSKRLKLQEELVHL